MSENTIVVIRIRGGCLTQVVGTNVTAVLIDEDNGTGAELVEVEDWGALDADEITTALELAEDGDHLDEMHAQAHPIDQYDASHPGWARLLNDLSKTE